MDADKSLARPGRKQATATEDFDVHISYFYRCTVHLEDSLIITPTNALVSYFLVYEELDCMRCSSFILLSSSTDIKADVDGFQLSLSLSAYFVEPNSCIIRTSAFVGVILSQLLRF